MTKKERGVLQCSGKKKKRKQLRRGTKDFFEFKIRAEEKRRRRRQRYRREGFDSRQK